MYCIVTPLYPPTGVTPHPPTHRRPTADPPRAPPPITRLRENASKPRGIRGVIGFWSKSDPRRVDRNKSCGSGSASFSVDHGASTEALTKMTWQTNP